jgi:nucleotide-binding universal stress UspA family protein
MLPFRHVVFPVDYSEPCHAIIPYVKDLVRRFSAELTLVHACGLGLEALGYSELSISDADFQEQSHAFEARRLRDFAVRMFPGQHVESIVKEGDAGTVIHKVIQHQGADLVMLPTHGFGPVRRFLLGSVTAKVLHDVGTAVWTGVHATLAEYQPRIPYKAILCALENDEEAEAVLRAAAAVAECYGAQLSLAHVVETPLAAWDVDFAPYKKDLMDSAEHWMWELKRNLGLDAPHTVIDAATTEGIRQAAIQKAADLVIAGRGHSQDLAGRIWSRLYPIIRQSPCPVLSI